MAHTRGRKKPRTPRKFPREPEPEPVPEQVQDAGAAAPAMDYQAIIKSHTLKQVIVNPKSKFVVCTYWWGRGNANKNYLRFGDETTDQAIKDGKRVNYACAGEFIEQIRDNLLEEMREAEEEEMAIEEVGDETEYYALPKEKRIALLKKINLKYDKKKIDSILARPDIHKKISDAMKQNEAQMTAEGKVKHEATKFEDMIDTWTKMCESVGCNYIVEEYPEFAFPGKYQLAINLKPLFIKEALLTAGKQGRGVLYIDGDMTIKRYPDIFDMPSIDFMARGWNIDPRGNINYVRNDVCFDPYIFETSGGTMFFAPTRQAVLLLKQWAKVSAQPDMQGKADDRILSMVFTTGRQNEAISSIQLPLEYLWLNDAYDFQNKEDIDQDRIYIEHPACLTAEETARDQGASASREPPKYEEIVTDMIDCAQPGGVFYEYVFFTERRFVESFEPYLKYLRRAKNNKGEPFFKIVDFDEHYGRYNKVAYKNMEQSNMIDVKTLPPIEMLAKLPQDTTVPMIIACFKNGNDVLIGDFKGNYSATYDLVAENIGDQHLSPYQRKIKIDTKKPIYMSGLNPVLIHLLMMCETLEDINQHYHESFLFASRIRAWWTKTDQV